MFLLEIWCEKVRIEFLAVCDLYLVAGETVLVGLQRACRTAGSGKACKKYQEKYVIKPSHTYKSYKNISI